MTDKQGPVLIAKVFKAPGGNMLALHFADGSLVPNQRLVTLSNGIDRPAVLVVELVVDGDRIALEAADG